MCVFRPKASSAAFLQGYAELSEGARSYEAAAFGKPVLWLYGAQDPSGTAAQISTLVSPPAAKASL